MTPVILLQKTENKAKMEMWKGKPHLKCMLVETYMKTISKIKKIQEVEANINVTEKILEIGNDKISKSKIDFIAD